MTPKTWGRWIPEAYESGTTIVVQREQAHKPHLYVFADAAVDDDRYLRDRYAMCQQLADYLNGGERPAWLDDFERTSEIVSKSLAGGSISAVGPMIDSDPPKLNWITDDSDDARNDRARLMDAVFFKQNVTEDVR